MAETAKKPSAKSTKKPAAKKAGKSVATKSSSDKATKSKITTTTKKVEVASVKTKKVVLSPIQKIRNLHIVNSIAYVAFAVIAVFSLKSTTSDVALVHQAKNVFEVDSGNKLAAATEILYSIQIRYVVAALFVVTAIGLFLLATRLRNRYESGVESGISAYRWVIYGISGAILIKLVSLVSGIEDVAVMSLSAVLVFVSAMFGWLSDRENVLSKNPRKLSLYASVVTGLLALLPLLLNLVGTWMYSTASFTWHIYALFIVLLLGVIANSMNLRASILKKAKFEYVVFENRYIRIDQIVKVLTILIIFLLLSKNA